MNDRRMDAWIDGSKKGKIGWVDWWMDGGMDRTINGWKEEMMDGWVDG